MKLPWVRQQAILTRLYRRFGAVYPTVFMVLELSLGAIVAVVGVLFLRLYLDMSAGELLAVLGAGAGAMLAIFPISIVRGHRLLRPVREWIRGDRSPEKSVEAWRAAIGLPLDVWPRVWYRQPLLLVSLFTASTTAILGLSWYEALFVFGISWLAVGYGMVLDWFTLEAGMRPVVADVSTHLPPDFEFGRSELPLRWKLFASLPFINVLTGVVVAGLTSPTNEIASLGIDVLAATAVAFSVSLVLTSRLTRSLISPMEDLVEAAARVERGDFEARVPVTTADEAGKVARAFNRMVAGLAERERIREAFGTYIDPEVGRRILEQGPSLAGDEVEVTVLFLDVRNFTGFAERHRPPEVVAILNRLFDLAVPIIHDHGGHVDKFIGDGLLAVFGAPRPQRDHAEQALAAACEIAAAVEEELGDELEIGIGLNSGTVVAGNVGGGGRLEFSVIGDAVNVAARVEAATRETGDTVLLSEHTRELLDGEAQLVERPGVTLKGRRDAVALYAPADGAGSEG
jgi:adenylate cyclase